MRWMAAGAIRWFFVFFRTSRTGDGDRLSPLAPAGVACPGSGCMATQAEDGVIPWT